MKNTLIQPLESEHFSNKIYQSVQEWIGHLVLKMELIEDSSEVLEYIETHRVKKQPAKRHKTVNI